MSLKRHLPTLKSLRLLKLFLLLLMAQNCTAASAQVTPLRSSAGTATATGEYRRLDLDEVAGVTLENGQLIVWGPARAVTLDMPPHIDVAQPVRHWALVTEAHVDGRKALTFTHAESLHDFTIEIPDTDAEIRYGGFANRSGGDVLVLAWGDGGRCYWAHLAIATPAASPSGR